MKCRVCGREIDVVFSLGFQPESNKYYDYDAKVEEHYPLHLCFCEQCKFLQMDEIISSKQIFSNDYPYMSSCSSEWLRHCKEYAEYMSERFGFDEKTYVVEIASNDGCLLKYFKDMGMDAIVEKAAEEGRSIEAAHNDMLGKRLNDVQSKGNKAPGPDSHGEGAKTHLQTAEEYAAQNKCSITEALRATAPVRKTA